MDSEAWHRHHRAHGGHAMPLRILHITGRSDAGGGPAHVHELITGLTRYGIESWVACPRSGMWAQRFALTLGINRCQWIPHRRFDPETFDRLLALHRLERFDLVHSHGMAAGIYGRLISASAGLPCVHTFHGVPLADGLKCFAYRRIVEPLLARWTAVAITVSHGERELAMSRYPCYGKRIELVPNGIAVPPMPPPARIAENLRIVSFSRPNAQKRPELVLDIAHAIRQLNTTARFDIYGAGLATVAWANAAREVGIHLHEATDDPLTVLAAADLYLSTSRWEGMPIAVIEALAHGAVVVASDVIGNRDVIQDGKNGLLFPEGDAGQAARLIVGLARDRPRTERMRHAGWEHVATHHSTPMMLRRLAEIYGRTAVGCPCR